MRCAASGFPACRHHRRRRRWLGLAAAAGLALCPALAVPAWAADPDGTPAAEKPDATPRPSSEAVKKELTAVIDAQLAAFRAGDYAKAYTFAAAGIKGMFEADAFERMVRASYPVIAHSSEADYGMAFDTGEEAVVNVRISNAEKKSVEYQYLLKKEDGQWKIGGVVEIRAEGLSV